jgi:hypothetical protein
MTTLQPTLDLKNKNKRKIRGRKPWMKNPTSKVWMKTFHLDET